MWMLKGNKNCGYLKLKRNVDTLSKQKKVYFHINTLFTNNPFLMNTERFRMRALFSFDNSCNNLFMLGRV